MASSSRFASPSSNLDLNALLHRLRRTWLSLALAVLVHLMLVGVDPLQQQAQQAARPLTTKFIKRQPRLTKPLELRKVPRLRRQIVRHEARLAEARMDQVQATTNFNTRSLIASHVTGSHFSLSGNAQGTARNESGLEPRLVASAITSTRSSERRIDMALEMLDINAMDTGRYRAMVVQDPNDKQGLKGFIKLARVHSMGFVIDDSAEGEVSGGLNVQEIEVLCDAVNEWTGLRADFVGSFAFADERLLEVPVIMPQGTPTTEVELQNMARYLLGGGFVLLEGFDRGRCRGGTGTSSGPGARLWRNMVVWLRAGVFTSSA